MQMPQHGKSNNNGIKDWNWFFFYVVNKFSFIARNKMEIYTIASHQKKKVFKIFLLMDVW